MSELKGKIDFTLFISATNANPNGDPLKWKQTACKSGWLWRNLRCMHQEKNQKPLTGYGGENFRTAR